MQPEPRLLVTDLDGTLLTSAKTITASTVAALVSAREAGLTLAIASARPYRLIETVVDSAVLELFSAVIVSNGAAVLKPSTRSILYEDTLSASSAETLIRTLGRAWPTAGFGWESGHDFSSDDAFLKLARTQAILRDPHPDRILPSPRSAVHQLVLAVPNAPSRTLVDQASALIGPDYTVTDSLGGVLEISPASVTKASAAEWWAGSLGLTLRDAIAFGDEHNDLPLLTRAGTGVAMANASDEVKAAATLTTLSNDQNGLAHALLNVLTGARP